MKCNYLLVWRIHTDLNVNRTYKLDIVLINQLREIGNLNYSDKLDWKLNRVCCILRKSKGILCNVQAVFLWALQDSILRVSASVSSYIFELCRWNKTAEETHWLVKPVWIAVSKSMSTILLCQLLVLRMAGNWLQIHLIYAYKNRVIHFLRCI